MVDQLQHATEALRKAPVQVERLKRTSEAELQRVVASIPVRRLRQAGVLDLLLALANDTDGGGQTTGSQGAAAAKDIADMDLDDLVSAAFMNDDD